MVKYRLIFEYKKEKDIVNNRENYLNDLLSDIDVIESETPIMVPNNGKVVVISNEEYEVISSKHTFSKEGDVVYYDTVVLLDNIRIRSEIAEAKKLSDLESLKKTNELQDKIMKDLVKKREEAKKAAEKYKQYPYIDPFEKSEDIGKYIWGPKKERKYSNWDIFMESPLLNKIK